MSSCITTTTTGPCITCVHPLDYLFDELVETGLQSPGSTPLSAINQFSASLYSPDFAEVLDRLLDKGIINTNCNLCCPGCANLYMLASVETALKLFEVVGPSNQFTCCNGFTECVDDLICAFTNDPNSGSTGAEIEDRLLDKGIVEFGNFVNNCTGASYGTEICRVLNKITGLAESTNYDEALNEVWQRIIDKGIVVVCYQGTIITASVETFLKWAEIVGFGIASNKSCCTNVYASVETYLGYFEAVIGGPVPALGNTTTTTIAPVTDTTTTV